MRIVLLSGEYPPQPGGVGDYTRRLAVALGERGCRVAVVTIRDGRLCVIDPDAARQDAPASVETDAGEAATETSPPWSGIKLDAYPPLDWSPRCWSAVIEVLDRLRPEWLHIQYQTGAYAMRPGVNLLPWRLRGLEGRPRIAVTFHDLLTPYLFPKAGPLRRWINWRLARDADAVIVTNPSDAERLQAVRPWMIPIGSNIPVAPPADFERTAWRARLGVGADEMLVAYFGLLAPTKGVDLLVEAMARLDSSWRLVLIGGAATAPQDRLHARAVRALIDRLGIADRVVETGYVAPAEVSAWLLAADMAALPFRDGASFRRGSLLAALSHGCPVVTTMPADAATTEALRSAAILTPPNDVKALASALAALGRDAAVRARMAAAGRALAARFDWATIAARHEALYRSVRQ